jgi:hypothetical protein
VRNSLVKDKETNLQHMKQRSTERSGVNCPVIYGGVLNAYTSNPRPTVAPGKSDKPTTAGIANPEQRSDPVSVFKI